MTIELKNFLSTYAELTANELDDVAAEFKKKDVKKNTYVLRHGEICKDLIFVQRGCLRMYSVANDIEVSVWFAFNHSSAIDLHSFISERPSNYFIQAIEDSEILFLPKAKLHTLYTTHPKTQEMIRRFWEDVIIHLIDRFTSLQKDSAEMRYNELLSKPQYLQRIPQKYLASFIGVTPTSLSRIRGKFK